MPDLQEARADRFMLDTLRVAFSLDAITTRDLPDSIAQAVRKGYVLFAELLFQRSTVSLPPRRREVDGLGIGCDPGKTEVPGALRAPLRPRELNQGRRSTRHLWEF